MKTLNKMFVKTRGQNAQIKYEAKTWGQNVWHMCFRHAFCKARQIRLDGPFWMYNSILEREKNDVADGSGYVEFWIDLSGFWKTWILMKS